MAFATLIVAALAALFTAGAAYAAWRAADIASKEAHARTEPYVSMGIPRQDYGRDALIIPLKNLGLGPARVVVLQVKDAQSTCSSPVRGTPLDAWQQLLPAQARLVSLECLQEHAQLVPIDTRVLEDPVQRAPLQLAVKRHDQEGRPVRMAQPDMTSPLPRDLPAEPLQHANELRAGDDR